jgi:hypothetical protein
MKEVNQMTKAKKIITLVIITSLVVALSALFSRYDFDDIISPFVFMMLFLLCVVVSVIFMLVKTVSMTKEVSEVNGDCNVYGVFENGYDEKFSFSPLMVTFGIIILIIGIVLCFAIEHVSYDMTHNEMGAYSTPSRTEAWRESWSATRQANELNLTILAVTVIAEGIMMILFPLYMYPTRVARRYEHNQTTVIAWINLFFAYTVLGWVLLLVWANSASSKSSPSAVSQIQVTPSSNADEIKKFKELLDGGVISQEEFDEKKKQLLGL